MEQLSSSVAKCIIRKSGLTFPITGQFRLEYGVEMLNAVNTVNLVGVPSRIVSGGSAGTFLDLTQLNSVGRSMRISWKLAW